MVYNINVELQIIQSKKQQPTNQTIEQNGQDKKSEPTNQESTIRSHD